MELENPERMGFFRRVWYYWLATFRLSARAVCVMSVNKGVVDFHDYPDSVGGFPDHFCDLTCRRCGKKFII